MITTNTDTTSPRPRALGYVRVSSQRQADSRIGLEAQQEALQAAAARDGLTVEAIYRDEAVTGAAPLERRVGLLDAIAALGRGDVLLVARRDRIGRDPIVVAMVERLVERRGARVASAAGEGTDDDSPTSVLMRRIIDAFSEYERLLIGARTKAAMARKRARGEKCGGFLRFGFDLAADGVTLIENAIEQQHLDLMRGLRAAGESFRAIARTLTAKGIPTKRGRSSWNHRQVQRVLEQE